MENEKVKKFHEDRKNNDRKSSRYLILMVVLYIISFALLLTDNLSVAVVLVVSLFSTGFMLWQISAESKDLHNRISVVEDWMVKNNQNGFTDKS